MLTPTDVLVRREQIELAANARDYRIAANFTAELHQDVLVAIATGTAEDPQELARLALHPNIRPGQ